MIRTLGVPAAVAILMLAQPSIVRAVGNATADVVVSRDVRHGEPVGPVAVFTGTDPQVCVHVTLYDVRNSHAVRWEVDRPNGSTYRTVQTKTESPEYGYVWKYYKVWQCWRIADNEPAFTLGRWSVKVMLDGQSLQTVGFEIIGVGAGAEEKMQARLEAMKARVAANPSDPWAHQDLADVLIDLKEFDDALSELHRALELDPQSATAYGLMGYLYHRRGDLDKAQQSLEQATRLADTYAWAHYQLALVYKEKSNTGNAIDHLRRVIQIAGDSSLGKAAQDELAKLGAAP